MIPDSDSLRPGPGRGSAAESAWQPGVQLASWYVPSIMMYISKIICESMYQYVLAGDTTVFRGMMKSTSDQMLQDYVRIAYIGI